MTKVLNWWNALPPEKKKKYKIAALIATAIITVVGIGFLAYQLLFWTPRIYVVARDSSGNRSDEELIVDPGTVVSFEITTTTRLYEVMDNMTEAKAVNRSQKRGKSFEEKAVFDSSASLRFTAIRRFLGFWEQRSRSQSILIMVRVPQPQSTVAVEVAKEPFVGKGFVAVVSVRQRPPQAVLPAMTSTQTSTPTTTATPSPGPSPTGTRTPTVTQTSTRTPTPTVGPSSTPTSTGTRTQTPLPTPTFPRTSTPWPTATFVPSPTPIPTPTKFSSPTGVPPTSVPPTAIPPTSVPPTSVPPTAVPTAEVLTLESGSVTSSYSITHTHEVTTESWGTASFTVQGRGTPRSVRYNIGGVNYRVNDADVKIDANGWVAQFDHTPTSAGVELVLAWAEGVTVSTNRWDFRLNVVSATPIPTEAPPPTEIPQPTLTPVPEKPVIVKVTITNGYQSDQEPLVTEGVGYLEAHCYRGQTLGLYVETSPNSLPIVAEGYYGGRFIGSSGSSTSEFLVAGEFDFTLQADNEGVLSDSTTIHVRVVERE